MTVRMPKPIYGELVVVAHSKKCSRNAIMVEAIAEYLRSYERAMIDAAFAGMARDPNYQREALELLQG